MTPVLLTSSVGLVLGGVPGAVIAGVGAWLWPHRSRRPPSPPSRQLVLVLLLVELRSGLSVLAALQSTAAGLPDYAVLRRVSRVATVSGLIGSISHCDDNLRPIVVQLARAQRSGASLTSAVRRMIEQDLAQMRSDKIAKARTLPVRLMIPVTLLMLPGLILVLYAPALIRTFNQLTGGWS